MVLLAACGGPREVTVKVTLPDMDGVETPASGVSVVALPYNRDSLLATLERAQGTPGRGRRDNTGFDMVIPRVQGSWGIGRRRATGGFLPGTA